MCNGALRKLETVYSNSVRIGVAAVEKSEWHLKEQEQRCQAVVKWKQAYLANCGQ